MGQNQEWVRCKRGLRTPNEAFFHQSPLSMFSINQLLFLQKTKPLYSNPKYFMGLGFELGPQRIRDLTIVCP